VRELTQRGYQPSDAPAVSEFFDIVEEAAGGRGGTTPEYVESLVKGMVHDPATDTRLLFAPDGTLVAAALTPTPPEGGFRVDLMGGVHPRWRGRGIGRELLGWQLERAAEIHRAVAPSTHWEIHVGANTPDEETLRLFRRFELTPVRYWFEMLASTGQVGPVPLPDGLRVMTYDAAWEQDLYTAHTEAFLDHWGYQRRELDEWAGMTVRAEGFAPDLSMIAFDGASIAGYVLSYAGPDPDHLYVALVGVRRLWRRRGLAAALLARVLTAAHAAGRKTVSLGVDAGSPTGAVGVYERVGFTVSREAVTYARPLPPLG
jgi:ribosomal protein S18 acetylase RimI-like enzyme